MREERKNVRERMGGKREGWREEVIKEKTNSGWEEGREKFIDMRKEKWERERIGEKKGGT